jgi:hypothetical protein
MKNFYYLLLLITISNSDKLHSQFGLSHEVGVIAGPVMMLSDYGERYNLETNFNNVGYGIGLVHYLSFYYDPQCNCEKPYSFFSDHFKLRTELSYNKTELKHFGRWVDSDKQSLDVQQLRGMRGVSENINLGLLLEYYPLSLRKFSYDIGGFAPYFAIGAQYVWTAPQAYSELGRLGDPNITFPKYLNAFSNESESVLSIVSSVGTRYKLSDRSDLNFDLRWQYYFSDWVDGLNPNKNIYKENKSNDWIFWLNFGYIYYIH